MSTSISSTTPTTISSSDTSSDIITPTTASPASPTSPNPDLRLVPVDSDTTLNSLRRLNSLLLPIPYSPRFYTTILTSPATDGRLTRLAYYRTSPSPVGAIRARYEPDPETQRGGRIYVMTLCTLSPFRGLGVGGMLVDYVKEVAREWGAEEVYAHVWEENREGIEWYEKRGFGRGETVGGYYRRLRPDGAVVVRLKVE